jgi:hypothetical protein
LFGFVGLFGVSRCAAKWKRRKRRFVLTSNELEASVADVRPLDVEQSGTVATVEFDDRVAT